VVERPSVDRDLAFTGTQKHPRYAGFPAACSEMLY
jgi:hypothetical protein